MKSSKDRAIIAQVAFKGAVDLAIAGKIEVKSILDATDAYAEHLWDTYGFENTYANQTSGGRSNTSGLATDKQINFINKLLKEVPKSVSELAQSKVDEGLSGVGASSLIKSLLEEKEKNEPKAKDPVNDNDLPF